MTLIIALAAALTLWAATTAYLIIAARRWRRELATAEAALATAVRLKRQHVDAARLAGRRDACVSAAADIHRVLTGEVLTLETVAAIASDREASAADPPLPGWRRQVREALTPPHGLAETGPIDVLDLDAYATGPAAERRAYAVAQLAELAREREPDPATVTDIARYLRFGGSGPGWVYASAGGVVADGTVRMTAKQRRRAIRKGRLPRAG